MNRQRLGQPMLAIWDSCVLEKAESLAAEGLCAVISSKAKRLKRIKPGFFNPPKGRPICVPGFHWMGLMLAGMSEYLDVIVPRGGKTLVERVQKEARVPVIGHLEGNCHVYIDRDADVRMARTIALNAKMRRTGICGAAETLLVDRACAGTHLGPVVRDLLDAGCEVRGDATVLEVDARVRPASEDDWYTEYLDAIIAARVVEDVDAAIAHIARYGSAHTESIVTENRATAERFLQRVDSAIVLHNASTQFADGGEFGMGAEIGISTDRFHARGPVGVEQLTSYKYVVRGAGQVRP